MLGQGLSVTSLLSLWPKSSRAGCLYALLSDIPRWSSLLMCSGSENKVIISAGDGIQVQ